MSTPDDYYTLETTADGATLGGVMRLHNPSAYAAVLEPVREAISAQAAGGGSYAMDLRALRTLNSSGITALARIVLAAKEESVPLKLVASRKIGWQRKTIPGLGRLYDGLSISFE